MALLPLWANSFILQFYSRSQKGDKTMLTIASPWNVSISLISPCRYTIICSGFHQFAVVYFGVNLKLILIKIIRPLFHFGYNLVLFIRIKLMSTCPHVHMLILRIRALNFVSLVTVRDTFLQHWRNTPTGSSSILVMVGGHNNGENNFGKGSDILYGGRSTRCTNAGINTTHDSADITGILFSSQHNFCKQLPPSSSIFIMSTILIPKFVLSYTYPVSILHKSIAGRYRPVRVADEPITARYRFM